MDVLEPEEKGDLLDYLVLLEDLDKMVIKEWMDLQANQVLLARWDLVEKLDLEACPDSLDHEVKMAGQEKWDKEVPLARLVYPALPE